MEALDELALDQLVDRALPQAFDVETAAAAVVREPCDELGGAVERVGADRVGSAPAEFGAAAGAVGGHGERLSALRTCLHHLDHLGYDVAGALHAHGVAFPDVFALDVVDVVQVGAADGDAADVHGPKHGDGRHDAGAADAGDDAE